MESVQKKLFELSDEKYAKFSAKLTPGLDESRVIGVRTPELRKIAKEMIKDGTYLEFISELPHKYFDENQLHGFIISLIKDYDQAVSEIDRFLPFIDNWATCDQTSPKVFKKNKELFINQIYIWLKSDHTYTVRFAIGMLMEHYLNDEDFKPEYLRLASGIKSEEYYINMEIAWYLATALAKQWDATIPIIEEQAMDRWVQNKTIQKAVESYRITDEQKAYLRTLKISK